MRVFILVILILTSAASPGLCDETFDSRLVEDYLSALKSRDDAEILSYWKAIFDNPETQQFMEANYPDAYSSWRIKGYEITLTQKLSDYREIYGAIETIPGGGDLPAPVFEAAGPMDNSERASLSLNKDQPSLREVWLRSIRAVLLDNGTAALRHPNQDQPSNQFIIGNRLKAMIAQQPAP